MLEFVRKGTLPFHFYGYSQKTVLEDEEVLQEIQGKLAENAKSGFIKAQDVRKIVASENIQTLFARLGVHKPRISLLMAQRWLAKMNWRYKEMKKGMYIDGHETMSWLIDMRSCNDGQITKPISNFGMIMEFPFKSLIHLIHTTSSLSHTMNLYSSKMMKGKPPGAIKTAGQPPNQKARGNR